VSLPSGKVSESGIKNSHDKDFHTWRLSIGLWISTALLMQSTTFVKVGASERKCLKCVKCAGLRMKRTRPNDNHDNYILINHVHTDDQNDQTKFRSDLTFTPDSRPIKMFALIHIDALTMDKLIQKDYRS